MKKFNLSCLSGILSTTAGVLFTTGAFSQEIAKTGSMAVPMPLNLEHAGDAIHNYSLGAGLRYTFKSEGNFTVAFGALHEWRNTRLDYGPVNGRNLYADLSRRAFQFQVLGIYKLGECKSTCGGEFSALLGADMSLPYSKDAQYTASSANETSHMVRIDNRTGYGLRAGLMMKKSMCAHLGFFISPEIGYRLVLDHPDYATLLDLPAQDSNLSDRVSMGMQMGIYLKLDKSMCPMKKG
ncbi:MAG: hypothetical protein IPJ76_11360 [Flavobacteriales bacterium]|nr:MAG: hypothetical protein IPJ76_11360 [Flavobacteriales bacterium]